MSPSLSRSGRSVCLILVVAATTAIWWTSRRAQDQAPHPTVGIRGSGQLTVAITGDVVLARPMPAPGEDAEFDAVVDLLRGTSLVVTNLDQNVTDHTVSTTSRRWPSAPPAAALDLRRIGIGVVSCANNHGLDYGVDGLRATRRLLRHAGLTAVGCGDDLGEARAAVVVGAVTARRVAIVAVTVSAAAEVRATAARGEIGGRPGVSAVRYSATITADPATFDALRAVAALRGGTVAPGDELQLAGTIIRKGPETVVDMRAEEGDVLEIVDIVEAARETADVVVVTLHNHEPSNRSTRPAAFVQALARRLVDAGANLVVGHGPHQLRGIEMYNGAAIAYSLGDFIFHDEGIDFGAVDVFEAGLDLYQQALGAGELMPESPTRGVTHRESWDSAIAVATFDEGGLGILRLVPLDLRADALAPHRGTPRIAHGERVSPTLEHLAQLSAELGTTMRIDGASGVVDVRLGVTSPGGR